MRGTGVLDLVTAVCAVLVTGIVVLQRCSGAKPIEETSSPVPVAAWDEVRRGGTVLEAADTGAIQLVIFSDFECPACRALTILALQPALRAHPGKLSVRYRHWPLSYHRFAYPLAVAAECAGEQGRFRAFHDLVFTLQDSIGFIPIKQFGINAGVVDLGAFEACIATDRHRTKIEADAELAEAVGGKGTPVVIMDGDLLPNPPDSARLDRLIRKQLSRRTSQ